MGEKPSQDELRERMVRYQQGDAAALEDLVRGLSPALLRYFNASGLMGEAEDLLQECWMQIHRSRHTYRPAEPLTPWVFAIARHVRLDGYRKRRRREARELLVAEVPEHLHPNAQPNAREGAPTRSGENDLGALLDTLPESQREVIVMLKVLGMTVEEVARATSSTAGAVKQKAHRGYVTLRRMLEGHHGG